jgi:hypothetical protein
MLHCHDHSIFIYCRNQKFFWETFSAYRPTVVPANRKKLWQFPKNSTFTMDHLQVCSNTMKNFWQVD